MAGERRRAAAQAAGAVILAVVGLVPARGIPAFYRASHPRTGSVTFLDKMVWEHLVFAPGAATFLSRNHIEGSAFNEYRWEAYLRWHCPALKIYMGGRAHQIYTPEDRDERERLVRDPQPARRLRAWGVDLLVIGPGTEYGRFVTSLMRDPDAGWAYLYIDDLALILADTATPHGRDLADRAATGNFSYPDEASALLSRGMCLGSPGMKTLPETAYSALRAALEERPAFYAYAMLADRGLAAEVPQEEIVSFLLGQRDRVLHDLAADPGDPELRQCVETINGMIRKK